MPKLPTYRTATLASGLSAALLLTACSGGASNELNAPASTTTLAAESSTTAVTAAPTTTSAPDDGADAMSEEALVDAASAIPSAMVTEVSSGETVDFASIAPADTPILLWMWAPH